MIRKYHNHKLQTNPWHREEELNEDNCIQIENNMDETMCQTTQIELFIEVLPSASGQPLAQIEQREIIRNQREDFYVS